MPTTAKRVVNGYPLTEIDTHHYQHQHVDFTKDTFWSAKHTDLPTTGQTYFNLRDAVADAASRGWLIPFDTCMWCHGHGWLRVPGSITLTTCGRCEGEGLDPIQPIFQVSEVAR